MNIWRRVISEELSFRVSTAQQVYLQHWTAFLFGSVLTGIVPGCAVVTLDKAFLFTDGRYFLQAENQLDELSNTILQLEDSEIDNVACDKELDLDETGSSRYLIRSSIFTGQMLIAKSFRCTNLAGVLVQGEEGLKSFLGVKCLMYVQ